MKEKIDGKLILAAILVVLGVFSRFIPHPPNFSPIMAVALFSGAFFANKKIGLLVPIISMFISDLFIGLHSTMFAVYLSFALIAIIGIKMKKVNTKNVLFGSIGGAVLFFVITNFAVWLGGWYEYTFAGLVTCFEMAIPFFRNTLASSVIYSGILFGGFYLAERYILQPTEAK